MSIVQPLDFETEELKPEIFVKDALLEEKENESVDMGAKHFLRENSRHRGFDADYLRASAAEDQEVDVLGCDEGISTSVVKAEDPDADATEQSSSFGDTFSGSDEGLKINSSDVEVDSPLCIENGHQRAFGGPVRIFRYVPFLCLKSF